MSQGNYKSGILTQSSSDKDNTEVNAITWRVHDTQKYAPILKGLFSQFVKEVVEGMIGYVRLLSIMTKFLADNGSQEFGDFKLTILGMLGTYSFERRILVCAFALWSMSFILNTSIFWIYLRSQILLNKGYCNFEVQGIIQECSQKIDCRCSVVL